LSYVNPINAITPNVTSDDVGVHNSSPVNRSNTEVILKNVRNSEGMLFKDMHYVSQRRSSSSSYLSSAANWIQGIYGFSCLPFLPTFQQQQIATDPATGSGQV
jgi:hypothetical protein